MAGDESRSEQEPVLVTVVLPCLDEARALGHCIDEASAGLEDLGLPAEILVIDNGSTDGSREIARAMGVRLVEEGESGYGSACRRGFDEALGSYVVIADADASYPLSMIPDFVRPLQRGFDVVIGNRFGGLMEPGAMPWSHRYIGNPVLSTMLRILFRTSVSDSHCGMRSVTADAYRLMGLRSPGMEFASEFVVQAVRCGLRIDEVSIPYRPREGESKLESFRDGIRHLRYMLLESRGR